MAFVALLAFIILLFGFVISFLLGDSITIFGQFDSYLDAIIFYLGQALDIVWLFVPKTIALICMGFSITSNVIRWVFKVALWVLRKIPFAGIS